jgi:glyoxylase-like metal-dependent hydrolase (beta-lactamase superfamily II)
MIFEQIRNGGDRNFGYLIGDEQSGLAAVVDPSYNPAGYVDRVRELGLTIRYVICTHSHQDHINGNDYIQEATDAEVVMYRDADYFYDTAVEDGDVIRLGNLELRIIHTPGHTDDGMCVLVENRLITGDTLFVGKVGGTDLDQGARRQYESLRRLMELDERVEVYPGHDYGVSPFSTIGHEKKTNPFIIQPSFEDFVALKKNWAEYKNQHGIA